MIKFLYFFLYSLNMLVLWVGLLLVVLNIFFNRNFYITFLTKYSILLSFIEVIMSVFVFSYINTTSLSYTIDARSRQNIWQIINYNRWILFIKQISTSCPWKLELYKLQLYVVTLIIRIMIYEALINNLI